MFNHTFSSLRHDLEESKTPEQATKHSVKTAAYLPIEYIASLLTSPGHRRSEGLLRPTSCLSQPRVCMCTLIVNRVRQVRFLEL